MGWDHVRCSIRKKTIYYRLSLFLKWSGWQDLNLQPLGPKPSALPSWATSRKNGAPEGIRTPDLLVRSQTLYPTELRAQLTLWSATELLLKKWWLQRESNQRHRDFQSLALPTELWSQMAVPTGLEPAIFCVTGRRVNQLHQGTINIIN